MSHFIEIQHVEMTFRGRKGSFHALRDINLVRTLVVELAAERALVRDFGYS